MNKLDIKNTKKITLCLVWSVVTIVSIFLILIVAEQIIKNKTARKIYNEFIDGERSIAGMEIYDISIPIGEPDRRYATNYIILDSNEDGMPELYIQTGREFYVFSYKDSETYILQSFFSHPTEYEVLKDGALIYCPIDAVGTGNHRQDYYYYFRLDTFGNEIDRTKFYWTDLNENNIYDEEDEYGFIVLGDEENGYSIEDSVCTKEEWFVKTRKYLYTDEDGKEQIRNQAEWIIYCEAK